MADVPPNLDLSALSVEQLNMLQQEIEKQKVTAKERTRQKVKEAITQLLHDSGLTAADLPGLFPRTARPASKSRAAYRHPENPRLTWTGRGRKPRWMAEYLAAEGNRLEDLKVK